MSILTYIRFGVVAAVVIAFSWLLWQNSRKADTIEQLEASKASLETSLKEAERVNKENEATYKLQKDQAERARDIAEQELLDYKQRDTRLRSILDELKQVPPEDRSPVSPVVCATLDRLYPDDETPSCPN